MNATLPSSLPSGRTARAVLTASHWGTYYALVEDGRVIGVRPFEHDPNPSPLIHGMAEAVHSPTRVARPSVREGWLKHGARDPHRNRGGERFIEVSWDEAEALVAREIDRVRGEHGNSSAAFLPAPAASPARSAITAWAPAW